MSQTWNMVERDMKTDEYFSLKMKLLPTKIIPKDENLELSYDHEFNVRSVCVCYSCANQFMGYKWWNFKWGWTSVISNQHGYSLSLSL